MLNNSPGPQSALKEETIAVYLRIFETSEQGSGGSAVEEGVDWDNAVAHVSDKDDEDAD